MLIWVAPWRPPEVEGWRSIQSRGQDRKTRSYADQAKGTYSALCTRQKGDRLIKISKNKKILKSSASGASTNRLIDKQMNWWKKQKVGHTGRQTAGQVHRTTYRHIRRQLGRQAGGLLNLQADDNDCHSHTLTSLHCIINFRSRR